MIFFLHSPGNSKNISKCVKDSKQSGSLAGQEQQCWAEEGHKKAKAKTDCKPLYSGTPTEAVVVNHLRKETQVLVIIGETNILSIQDYIYIIKFT